jgi:7,8-dihydropterin-6-yl-methyl-4-(beta-D-ribofuranosyl)aminobenzene 5'-phosphate synthase
MTTKTDIPPLVEVDSLQAVVIIDNELDPISPPAPDTVQVFGNMAHIALGISPKLDAAERGGAAVELQMENLCCSAHGLSIMVVRIRENYFKSFSFPFKPVKKKYEERKPIRGIVTREETGK